MRKFDAIVVGSGPNGLAAAIALAQWGHSVCVFEAKQTLGGGLHSLDLGDPDFVHDQCSAIHPMGVLSPYLQGLSLESHGLSWCTGESSVAHPFDDGPAAILYKDFERTGERLGERDGKKWRQIYEPFLPRGEELFADLMGPLNLWPRHLPGALRFGWLARSSARKFALGHFESERARGLFAGLAGHSVLPLEQGLTAAFGLIFGISAHRADWPCAKGGSQSIADALVSKLRSLGGEIRSGERVDSLAQLPSSRVVLLDLAPRGVVELMADDLPLGYQRRLLSYRYGPGTFKMDWTLEASIPWADPEVRGASTVHLGGTWEEIAASERAACQGQAPTSPYLIVCQQSEMDPSRSPFPRHSGYAYCHVPSGYEGDLSTIIEKQVERFAPGFRDLIASRRATSPKDFERMNPNFVGGAVTGGAADLWQLFTRPVARWDPYTTPNPRVFLCSASTPPGGGVHGMCGYYAARSAARRLGTRVPRLGPGGAPFLLGT